MAVSSNSKFHIAMFPWLAIGHMTPLLHLANELAKRGHTITYFLPKKAQLQLQHLNLYPNLITFHTLTIPHVDGLPPGTETASDIPIHLCTFLTEASDLTQDQVELAFIAKKPNFVIHDNVHWMPQFVKQFGIKSICYHAVSAASVAIVFVPGFNLPKDRPITKEDLSQPPPGYPSSKVVLLEHESPALMMISQPLGKNMTFYERMIKAKKESDAIAMRTCQEFEGKLCEYIATQYQKPVFLTGPVLPGEDTKTPLEDRWANWLGGFNPGSVVFCAFGSQFILEKDQFQELVLGFELTGLPFLIVLKPPTGCATIEEALPEGFEERVKGRGVVYGGWVKQPLILKHPSVGCFVSHCGFGSMWESLMSDCQIVLVPLLWDQILNTRQLAEELEIAVEVEREKNGWFPKESLCKAIKSVMDTDSEVGMKVKNNHTKWKEILGKPEFLNGYVDRFVQNLHELDGAK
ncbi:UDP-glycosyltransferase [Quillaja saponaria]|uniref:Glycosyltransferase n=1 Tax=Quillaja saponaria TaxID=32244 RepID=A0AAD7QHT8_QUISA|nr:UDP-glycosyltransferase [Quillaja saponaria]